MSSRHTTPVDALDALLADASLLLLQVLQGTARSAAAIERVCAVVATEVQKRVRELSAQRLSEADLRRLRERQRVLKALDFAIRCSAHEMNSMLGQILPSQSSGAYSPEKLRVATAGAWMNVRSAP
jgi:hypothetical protein